MQTTTIVHATLTDAPIIRAIQKRAFAEEGRLCGTEDIPPLTETQAAIAAHIDTQTALVARAGDGTIIGSVRGLAAGTVCTIRALAVEPAHHGQGVGAALLRAIEAAHPQATRFELTTNTIVPGNVRFYERHGYRVHELTRHSDEITLAQMSKVRAMNHTLTLTDVADEEVRKAILAPLAEYNASQAGPSQGRPLAVLVKDDAGVITGGLWGYTAYEWMFTQLLVVPAALRGRGVGTQVMHMAEREAVQRGCHGAWLDTFEFQARGFYERLGYTCFGELADYPTGCSRYFMKKALTRR